MHDSGEVLVLIALGQARGVVKTASSGKIHGQTVITIKQTGAFGVAHVAGMASPFAIAANDRGEGRRANLSQDEAQRNPGATQVAMRCPPLDCGA